MWHGAEDADEDARQDERSEHSLDEDGILDLTKSRLLNPDFTVEDLADNEALLVLGDPGFIFVAVAVGADEGIGREARFVVDHFVVVSEQLPWAEVAVMHAVEDLSLLVNADMGVNLGLTYHTHALPCCDEGSDTDKPERECNHTPATTSVTESDEKVDKETTNDTEDTKTAGKDDTRTVAVADGPADEVRVGLFTERPLDSVDDVSEGRWVGGVLKSVKDRGSFTIG